MRICALIATRNEAPFLQYLIPYLAAQAIDVVILDQESTDGTVAIARSFLGRGVLKMVSVPFTGYFSLRDQLRQKQDLADTLGHDWIIHHDADEIFEDHRPGKTLREAIEDADQQGYTVLNFDEFAFVPTGGQSYEGRDYRHEMQHYYFFEPYPLRLMRAWKRDIQALNVDHGGHRLAGDGVRLYPHNHILRHYIGLSEAHLRRKYLNRAFAPAEVEAGWHSNRVIIRASNLIVPKEAALQSLPAPPSKAFDKSVPHQTHFWQW